MQVLLVVGGHVSLLRVLVLGRLPLHLRQREQLHFHLQGRLSIFVPEPRAQALRLDQGQGQETVRLGVSRRVPHECWEKRKVRGLVMSNSTSLDIDRWFA